MGRRQKYVIIHNIFLFHTTPNIEREILETGQAHEGGLRGRQMKWVVEVVSQSEVDGGQGVSKEERDVWVHPVPKFRAPIRPELCWVEPAQTGEEGGEGTALPFRDHLERCECFN